MKKLYLVLLAGVLLTVFSMPAVAADVKFFGDYYAIGQWASNYSLSDDPAVNSQARGTVGQRFRLYTVFQVQEGLKLTTRFDAMEKIWGQDAAIGTPNPTSGVGSNVENNISWERAFVTFNLGPGYFDVGYQAQGYWSPVAFGNTSASSGAMIRYTAPIGPVTLSAYWENCKESNVDPTAYQPSDWDRYALQGAYKWKSGQAGLQLLWEHYETTGATTYDIWNTRVTPAGLTAATLNYYEISPFFQAKLGPVDLEGKLYWTTGEFQQKSTGNDLDIDGLSAYLNGKVNVGPAYIGAMFAYIKGDDPNDSDVTVSHGGGRDWDPTLMLGNDRFSKWLGGRYANTIGFGTPSGGVDFRGGWSEQNLWLYQGYVGYSPIPKLSLKASFSYMKQDETRAGFDDHIGNEFDITAAYKIYPNLTYTIGFGYFWAGDYFKGTNAAANIDDCYLLMHQLAMTF
ncbi:MAG: hypothetical protein ABFD62_09875 [Syntrophaceae bacterium]